MRIPLLRAGQPYRSLKVTELRHVATGEPVAEVSQANQGIITRDLLNARENQRALAASGADELIDICRRAADLFQTAALPVAGVEDGQPLHTPDDYISCLSATTGLPHTLCRSNMEKIRRVLAHMDEVIAGLTRGMNAAVLDEGWGVQDGRTLSYRRQTEALGAVLPSNSPGVHGLWLPSIPLKVPVVLKPGSEEPWTPYRIAAALVAAGCPEQAISLYPTDYGGATQILLHCDRSLLFGGGETVRPWLDDPRIEVHGPGRSKILLGADEARRWEKHLDLIVDSVAANGGRSCINASSVWTTERGRDIAEAVAARLAQIEPAPLDDPGAQMAAFANPEAATRISAAIDRQLGQPGAKDVTMAHYGTNERVVTVGGCTFLRPTAILCTELSHPLANTEYLFPFVSVVEVKQAEMSRRIGPSLVATALTEDERLVADLMESADIDRLNIGPIPTHQVSWDQPHEGNLFEHLYRQRSFATALRA